MSTRRTTRASSRAASSRASSPAISTTDIPETPVRRSARRAGHTPLPAVGLRSSTAYGTNTVAEPSRASGPVVGDQITNVLTGLLEPVYEETASNVSARTHTRTPGRRGRKKVIQSPIDSNRTYNNESGVFREGGIESSIADPSDLGYFAEEPEYEFPPVSKSRAERREEENFQVIEQLAHQRIIEEEEHGPAFSHPGEAAEDGFAKLKGFMKSAANPLNFFRRNIFMTALALLLLALLTTFLGSEGYHWYGWDVKHNVGQFIPFSVAHPLSAFSSSEVQSLNRRMTNLEYQVKALTKSSSSNEGAIDRLEKILPDSLILKKDNRGNLLIPNDFYTALLSKLRADITPPEPKSSDDSLSGERGFRKTALAIWEEYKKNDKVLQDVLSGADLKTQFPNLLKDHSVVTKAELLRIIQNEWDKNKHLIESDVSRLLTDRITKLVRRGITEKEVKYMIDQAKLEGFAKSNLKYAGYDRINHFSPGAGAVIIPSLTSKTFIFPSMDVWPWKRAVRWAMSNPVPHPKSARTALEKWDEHGDCWCGRGPSQKDPVVDLGVLMANNIYPDQIIVEHVSRTASLEPGSAPREMELLAYIPDTKTFNAVKSASDRIFSEAEQDDLPENYVRIATWIYDIELGENVGVFGPQLKLNDFRVGTNKLIVRTRDNWGTVDYTCLYRVKIFGDIASDTDIS